MNTGRELHTDLEKDNFPELLECDGQELTSKNLMALELHRIEDNVTEEEEEAEDTTRFNTNWLAEGFRMTEKALACFEFQDPNIQKLTKVLAAVHNATACYKMSHEEMKRATVKTFLPNHSKLVRINRKPKSISTYVCRT